MRLRKKWPPKQEIGDGGETIQRWSANWELCDYPGLCLSKLKPSGQASAGWSFSCPAIVWVEDEQQSGYQQGLILFEHLKGQVFVTRLEALQALKAALTLLGDE